MSDVLAEEEVVAMDFLDLLIYFGLCLGDVFTSSYAHHYATAISLEHAVVILCTHVEDWAVEELNSLNDSAFRIVARVALRGKYNTDSSFLAPVHRLIAF